MSRPKAILLAVFLAIAGLAATARPLAFFLLERRIAREYPQVRRISTAELAAWRADPGRVQPLLLDTRTPEEFAVSHLAGARRIDPGGEDLSALAGVSHDTPIVTYCSIGYRSARVAERLREAGFQDVENLEGSLFAWANEGRPLASDHGAAMRVHPYDRLWGRLLKGRLRAPVAPPSAQPAAGASASPRSS